MSDNVDMYDTVELREAAIKEAADLNTEEKVRVHEQAEKLLEEVGVDGTPQLVHWLLLRATKAEQSTVEFMGTIAARNSELHTTRRFVEFLIEGPKGKGEVLPEIIEELVILRKVHQGLLDDQAAEAKLDDAEGALSAERHRIHCGQAETKDLTELNLDLREAQRERARVKETFAKTLHSAKRYLKPRP